MDDLTPPDGITPEDWTATPPAVRQFIGVLLHVLSLQQQQLADQHQHILLLQARIAELEARLNQHSQNSSKPPSSDPPSAPPRPARVPRGRKAGAQPRHPHHERPDPSPEQITQVQEHYPDSCARCQSQLLDRRYDACAVRTQYVWELPIIQPEITSHHYHTLCCQNCGELTTAERPPDVPPGAFGPRTAAAIAVLHGDYHLSDRLVPRLLHEFFSLPLSLGGVVDVQQTASAALEPVYTTIHTAVQQQDRCNIDERGWKEAGQRRWLWTMVTAIASVFVVASSRSGPALRQLLGECFDGIMTSDRHRPYLSQSPERHQLCLRHLMAQLPGIGRSGRNAGDLGSRLLGTEPRRVSPLAPGRAKARSIA
jgi:transposase